MVIHFHINYRASGGECLELIYDCGRQASLRLHSHDSSNWEGQIDVPQNSGGTTLSYHYRVYSPNGAARAEWHAMPHTLCLPAEASGVIEVHDRWRDFTPLSPLCTSAFTECLNRRERNTALPSARPGTVTIAVLAPQLRAWHTLRLAGSSKPLGEWDPAKAVPMHETQPCTWQASLNAATLAGAEFKFIAVDSRNGSMEWESGCNRSADILPADPYTAIRIEMGEARFDGIEPQRIAGTVVPVFSLKSSGSFGVGDFGDLAAFAGWIALTGQQAIQLLPVNDTTISHTPTDSYPYNSISIYALHPQYADLRQLPRLADAKRRQHYAELQRQLNALPQIDYVAVNKAKLQYLREVYEQERSHIEDDEDYRQFVAANRHWLLPYARYCCLRDATGGTDFAQWPSPSDESHDESCGFWAFVQHTLHRQLTAAHRTARSKGVVLKGDVPIGISRNGVEAWVEPRLFNIDGQAGAPPDAFSADGQNWGFPTYNWPAMLADGCSWWRHRFEKMAEYFDAYRIDHVLGFFRIWEIPLHSVTGLLGQFSPALGMTCEEIESFGLKFDAEAMCRPLITDPILTQIFGPEASRAKRDFTEMRGGRLCLKPQFATQRQADASLPDGPMKSGLMRLISNVLWVRDRSTPGLYHPRICAQSDFYYKSLGDADRQAFDQLYEYYFYHRHNRFWYAEAMKKLPALTQSTRMLACAEDLGMVPECVPWVMDELKILTLEIQSMPKQVGIEFGRLSDNPYLSVSTISTHDMPTMRQWWDEDSGRAQRYYAHVLGHSGNAPHPMPAPLAQEVVERHLASPSALCLLSVQDWLATDEAARLADPNAERINVPANPRHYWRYRMHLTIEELAANTRLTQKIKRLVADSHRAPEQ